MARQRKWKPQPTREEITARRKADAKRRVRIEVEALLVIDANDLPEQWRDEWQKAISVDLERGRELLARLQLAHTVDEVNAALAAAADFVNPQKTSFWPLVVKRRLN